MNKFTDYINNYIELDKKASMVKGKRVLNTEQASIFKDITATYKTAKTAFLTGEAGTGKSVLISAIQKWALANNVTCQITASTGKAASALGGVTIHSYIGLRMTENNHADNKDDALILTKSDTDNELPDILIIDEASQIGQKILREIKSENFPYILFVGDASQLNPVKDKKVEWDKFANRQYVLSKVMRAQDPDILKVFADFRAQKEGKLKDLNIFDYENGRNIVRFDYKDIGKIPTNAEVSFIGYRNKLVDMMVGKLSEKKHNVYNLNLGVKQTVMKVVRDKDTHEPVYQDNGFFEREFVNGSTFANGEDVEIVHLNDVTKTLVNTKRSRYGKWNLKLTANGIMISDATAKINFADKEPVEDKYYIGFPQPEVLEYCTLSAIEGNTFALIWDGTVEEYDNMTTHYFDELQPYLKKYQTIQAYYKGKDPSLSCLDSDVKSKMLSNDKKIFMAWYEWHLDTEMRKKGWKNFLSASSVVSARKSTSRTITKAQGLSMPVVILCNDSFFGCSDAGKYVAVSRAKSAIVLIDNVPDTWKDINNG